MACSRKVSCFSDFHSRFTSSPVEKNWKRRLSEIPIGKSARKIWKTTESVSMKLKQVPNSNLDHQLDWNLSVDRKCDIETTMFLSCLKQRVARLPVTFHKTWYDCKIFISRLINIRHRCNRRQWCHQWCQYRSTFSDITATQSAWCSLKILIASLNWLEFYTTSFQKIYVCQRFKFPWNLCHSFPLINLICNFPN